VFNQVSFPFEYTPRKFVIHNESAHILLIETEHNAYTEETKQQRRLQMAEEMQEAAGAEEAAVARELAEAFLSEEPNEQVFGAPRAGPGLWASMIRVMAPTSGTTFQVHRLEQNLAALW
jgi:splicing factor 3B subunit 3